MKRTFMLLSMLCMVKMLSAQYVYTIKADSVKITNSCDTAELIIENHTQNVSGFLFNKGKGRTEFRKAVIKLNDSTYVFGGDTVILAIPLQAHNGLSILNKNIVLGQEPGQPGNAASFLNHREIPTNNYNLSLTGGGSLLVNSNTLEGSEKLQVANSIAVVDTPGMGRFTISKISNTASIKFNSASSTSPTLTFVDNRGFVIGGNGQTTPLASQSLISIYPKDNNDGFSPLINVQPYPGNFYLRVLAAKNLSNGNFAGCGLHFQNDVNRTLQLYVTGSGTSNTTGGPDASVLWTSTEKGLRLTATSTDTSAGILFTTRGASSAHVRGLINNAGNWILQDSTNNPVDNGSKLQVTGNETVSGRVGIGTSTPDAKLHVTLVPASGSVGVFHVQGVDNFSQAFVLQVPTSGYTGNIFQTYKGFGSLGGAMGIGVRFENNVPQYLNIINNNSQNLVRVYNENNLTGPTLRFIIGRDGANTGQMFQVKGTASITGNSIFGDTVNVPSAKVQIAAGTSDAGTAPLKLTAGMVLATPEDGAIEYDGTDLYLTQFTTRYKLAKTLAGQLTTSFGAPALTAFTAVTTTLSVAGAQTGDVVMVSANSGAVNPASLVITAFVASANTVTIQAYNAGNSTVNIASDTYKIRIVR